MKSKFYRIVRNILLRFPVQRTFFLKTIGRSDVLRWGDPQSLSQDWDSRTIELSKFIPINSTILEFGAGRAILRNHVPPGCEYTPADLVARSNDSLVIDINSDDWPTLQKYDVVVFSGVLEYVHDLPLLFAKLIPVCNFIVCSYASTDYDAQRSTHIRRHHGWVNDLTAIEFVSMLNSAGYTCVSRGAWNSQELYLFQRESAEGSSGNNQQCEGR